jgi:hypothetical protein
MQIKSLFKSKLFRTLLLLIALLITGLLVDTLFVSKKSNDYFYVCCDNNKIKIELASAFKYITKYEIVSDNNNLRINIYVTTLANFLTSARKPA